MKRYLSVLVAVIIAGLVFAGLSGGMGAKPQTNKGILSVNDIQADPAAYSGTITINGVVAGLSKDNARTFTIIDTAEAKLCKTVTCARFYLPVFFAGPAPKVGDEVNVTGSFQNKGQNFSAQQVDVLRHVSY
ncbi:MAG: hypothetical protein ACYC9I_00135 [Desulfuromonadales bacterium]|jgi:hypothetical protein